MLDDILARLGAVDLGSTASLTLCHAAAELADAVRASISAGPPGLHEVPWLVTGSLRDSIGSAVNADGATVGSTSDVAMYQEFGTATVPPRPFLAPVASDQGEMIANAIGIAVGQALAGALSSSGRHI